MDNKSTAEKNGRGPAMPALGANLMRKKDSKKAGAAGGLLAKLGLGGLGGGAASGGAASGAGGLLATKTGIVALVLAGTSVAAGIGILATSGGSSKSGVRGSIFQQAGARVSGAVASLRGTPRDLTGESVQPAAGDGVSASLDNFNKANQGSWGAGEAPAEGGEQVADAAGAGTVGDSGVGVPDHNIDLSGGGTSAGSRPKLKTGKGFKSAASGASAGGGATLSAKAPAAAKRPGLGADANGQTGRFSASRTTKAGARRGSSVARGRSASAQAANTRNVVRAARGNRNASMQTAGTTYDGGRGSVGTIGAASSSVGDPGYGTRATGLQAGQPNPSTVVNTRETPAPAVDGGESKKKKYKDYKKLLWTGVGLMLGAGALILLAGKLKKKADSSTDLTGTERTSLYTAVKWIAGIAALMAAAAMAIGIKIASGPYGQKDQGMMIAALGGVMALYAGTVIWDAFASEKMEVGKAAEMGFFEKLFLGKLW